MSSQSSVTTDTLRRLHTIHERLRDLQGRLDRGPRVSQAHETNLERLQTQLAELQAKAKDLRVKTDEKQLHLKSGEANVERRRQQMRESKDNREYQALGDQINADQMANSVLEDEILECMEKLDLLNAKVKEAEQAVAKAREDAGKNNQDWEAEAPVIRGDIQRLEAELKQVEADLSADFRDLYRRLIRAKGGDALAAIHGEFCGGCNQHVPLNMVNGVMLGKPLCCKSCGRLLYVEEDQTPGK
jgi:predicted  nucleic acid-binding Zn-ribbon protein